MDVVELNALDLNALVTREETQRTPTGLTSPSSSVDPGIIVHGPYLPLAEGSYEIEAQLKVSDIKGSGRWGVEVICGPRYEKLAEDFLEVRNTEDKAKVVPIKLPFTVPERLSGGVMELRVWKDGAYALTLVEVDFRRR
jgi:hypothetical protein